MSRHEQRAGRNDDNGVLHEALDESVLFAKPRTAQKPGVGDEVDETCRGADQHCQSTMPWPKGIDVVMTLWRANRAA